MIMDSRLPTSTISFASDRRFADADDAVGDGDGESALHVAVADVAQHGSFIYKS